MSKVVVSPSIEVKALSDEISKTAREVCDKKYDGWDCDMRDDMALTRYTYDKLTTGQAHTLKMSQVVEFLYKMGYTLKIVPRSVGGSIWK